ncbi:2-keto-4-pentenoate hydratase, partial [Vibrio vulnificus]
MKTKNNTDDRTARFEKGREMKLATKKSAHRDGELIVVSRDLSRYVSAADIARSEE